MRATNVLHADPILMGAPYPLPDGRTIWHMPPLSDDATEEQRRYRAWALARLDLYGHEVVDGDMQALIAALTSEACDD